MLLLRTWNKEYMLLKGSSPSEGWASAADSICSKRDPYPEKATGIRASLPTKTSCYSLLSVTEDCCLVLDYFPLCMVTPREEYDSNETRRSVQLKRLAPRY